MDGSARRLTRFELEVLHGATTEGAMLPAWRAIAEEVGALVGVPVLYTGFGIDQQWGEPDTVPRLALVAADDAGKATLEKTLAAAGELAMNRLREGMGAKPPAEFFRSGKHQISHPQYVGLLIPTAYSVTGLRAVEAAVKAEQERRNFAPRLAAKYADKISSMSEYAAGVFHVFYRTDEIGAECRANGFEEALAEEVLANLHELGQTGMTRERLKLEFYSEEYIQREFGGRMQDFYR